MNIYNNLKIKSQQNYEIAEKAKNDTYYDVAVSRYYYSLFQLIDYILFNKKDKFIVPTMGGSHRFTIDEFNRLIYRKYKKKLDEEDFAYLQVLDDLKRWRQTADYKNRLISDKEFVDEFMKKFKPCYDVVYTKLLNEEG